MIRWPNVIRIDRTYKHRLSVDWEKIEPLPIKSSDIMRIAETAPVVDSKPDSSRTQDIDLEKLIGGIRKQTIIFKTAQSLYKEMKPDWEVAEPILLAEIVRLAEEFINSDLIKITPESYNRDEEKRNLLIKLSMSEVIRHFWQTIKLNNTEKMTLVLDSNHPICSTGDMPQWRTSKPCDVAEKSHINYCVHDSTWEAVGAFQLDKNEAVDAWVKNDKHLNFHVLYIHNGMVGSYYPDFIIRLKSGIHLIIEVKGQQTEEDDAKQSYMNQWIQAVNEDGRYGQWAFGVAREPSELIDILAEYGNLENLEQLAG